MYQALYRKYRPRTFDEVVGQKSVTDTLKAQLQSGHLSHAYLFTGTRGTGKTSCAKILAKAVNCLHPVDGNPCNTCAVCQAIESGACTDVQEIDAASNNGVDNVRALRDDAVYTPAEAKMRVYIIDEVHMLSMAAFNALLKTIEEPPEHLLFILATTELHKVPATILSRCQRFSFRRLLPQDIAGRITDVAAREQIAIDADAAALLSHLADGALRDGMSLLDQCASAGGGTVTTEGIYRCLGLAGEQKTGEMMQAIAAHDTQTALALFSALYSSGKDLAAMFDELTALARDLLMMKTAPRSAGQMLSGVSEAAQVLQLEKLFTAQELLAMVGLLQQTAAGFSRSPNPRIDCELCLMQLCMPQLQPDWQALNARLSRVEEQLKSGVVVQAAAQDPAQPEAPVAEAPAGPAPQVQTPDEAPEAGESGDPEADDSFWPELVERLRGALKPPALGFFSAAPDAPLRGKLQGQTLHLVASDPFVKGMVDKPPILEQVRQKAAALAGCPVQVKLSVRGQQTLEHAKQMEQLIEFGKEHADLVTIHSERESY